MELKRILAKDLRSASEQATALYGPDALIVSHEMVNGRTEVIVAVDLQADHGELFDEPHDRGVAARASNPEAGHFDDHLQTALRPQGKSNPQSTDASTRRGRPGASGAAAPAETDLGREQIRAREIIDLVRQEMSSLRRELRLSQQPGINPKFSQNSVVRMIDHALEADHAPMGLRMLMADELEAVREPAEAIEVLRQILHASLSSGQTFQGPLAGIHALLGPSGSGKTSMVIRLARQMADSLGEDQVAVISWADQRPGAWQQIHLGCSKVGLECFRAAQPDQLPEILESLTDRSLVLIDSPGVALNDHRRLLSGLAPQAHQHLVLPSDVAAHQAERLLRSHAWQSLMISKLDEAHHLWGLIQALSHVPSVLFPVAGDGPRPTDLATMSVGELVETALEGLAERIQPSPTTDNPVKPARMGSTGTISAQAWATIRPS